MMSMHKIHTNLAALTSALLIAAPLPILAQTDASFAGGAARVIVKLKADSPLLPKAAISGTVQRPRHAKTFGDRLGMTMADGEALSERSQVVFASGITSAELAQRLARQADVEYAVPDERRHILTAPNDPLYANGVPGTGPAVGQWYLRAPSATLASSIKDRKSTRLNSSHVAISYAVVCLEKKKLER